MTYTAEEIEKLLAAGALERIGMGSRRACYRLPDGLHCLKCYRSDAEIAEGRHPASSPVKPLASAVVREIRRHRFNERRNTCCQEYHYWIELKKRLSPDLAVVFPLEMELLRLPSRGWSIVEEFVVNADGAPSRAFGYEWWAVDVGRRAELTEALKSLCDELVGNAVRFYDPQNVQVQCLADGSFLLRITDFEPGSRLFVPLDWVPAFVRLQTRRRFMRYMRNWGVTMQGEVK